jgi:hypothetical protein
MSSSVHDTQLEQDFNSFHALLEEGIITPQVVHGTVLFNLPKRPRPCMGIQLHGHGATNSDRRIC